MRRLRSGRGPLRRIALFTLFLALLAHWSSAPVVVVLPVALVAPLALYPCSSSCPLPLMSLMLLVWLTPLLLMRLLLMLMLC